MRLLHVVPSYYPATRYGGPIVTVRRLCEALVQAGAEVDVATTDANGHGDSEVPTDRWVGLDGVRIRYFHRWPRIDFALSRALSRFLTSATRNYDLVHIHGTMHFPSFAACAAARAADVPYVVSPLGSVQPWSLAQKRWKKLPYWTLIEHRNLKGAAALHAASEREADAIRALLPNARVILSPRGMEPLNLPIVERSPRKIVFLGRIHKVKGFDVLIPALSQVCAAMPGVETVFAGPDDDGEWRRVVRLLENSRPRPAFRYIGAVSGDEKWRLLATSTVLVLPSHTENFGMAVLEALACGTPVVASKNTPWSAVEERGAGFWVTNSPDQLASALVAILGNPALASRMGKAALALAKEYSWPTIGVEMLRTYRGILSSRSG